MAERPWYTGPVMVVRTATRTGEMLKHHRLGRFVPAFFVLLAGAAVLWVINTIAPLAPFVYSLF